MPRPTRQAEGTEPSEGRPKKTTFSSSICGTKGRFFWTPCTYLLFPSVPLCTSSGLKCEGVKPVQQLQQVEQVEQVEQINWVQMSTAGYNRLQLATAGYSWV